MHEHKMQAA